MKYSTARYTVTHEGKVIICGECNIYYIWPIDKVQDYCPRCYVTFRFATRKEQIISDTPKRSY